MNEVVTINTDNYATMAKAIGVPTKSTEKRTNVLKKFNFWKYHPMGKEHKNRGKKKNHK